MFHGTKAQPADGAMPVATGLMKTMTGHTARSHDVTCEGAMLRAG